LRPTGMNIVPDRVLVASNTLLNQVDYGEHSGGVSAGDQDKTTLRLREYPQRVERLKKLWIDVYAGGATHPRQSSRLACAGAASIRSGASSVASVHQRSRGEDSSTLGRRAISAARVYGYPYRQVVDYAPVRRRTQSATRSSASRGSRASPCPLTERQMVEMMTRDLTPEDYELLLLLDEGIKKSRLLDSVAAAALPKVEDHGSEDCRICLCPVEVADDVRRLPACGHTYHAQCIQHWLTTSKASCPLCGAEVCEFG